MDARLFDSLTRAISGPRRAVAGGLLGLALAPLTASAKRKKHRKKKKKPACTAPSFACGKKACCDNNQQCVSGQCEDPAPDPGLCGTFECTGFINPIQQGGACACRATTSGPTLCFAQQPCGGLTPCSADNDCSDGFACMDDACGGNPTCVRTCV